GRRVRAVPAVGGGSRSSFVSRAGGDGRPRAAAGRPDVLVASRGGANGLVELGGNGYSFVPAACDQVNSAAAGQYAGPRYGGAGAEAIDDPRRRAGGGGVGGRRLARAERRNRTGRTPDPGPRGRGHRAAGLPAA